VEKQKPRKIKKGFLTNEDVPLEEIPRIKAGADFVTARGKVFKNSEITTDPPKPRSFAYCSDTGYFEPVIDVIKNVDLLYHEASFMNDMEEVAIEKFHSTAAQAATIANKAGAGELVIGHFSARYKMLDELHEEAKTIFPNTQLAEDGKVFSLESKVQNS
jgi:ribonuclease Z